METFTADPLSYAVTIEAPAQKVWQALVDPQLMQQWMLEERTDIITDWKIGSPIRIEGKEHWIHFENHGTVLQFEPNKMLEYTHLSSLSKLPAVPVNYTSILFRLESIENHTILTVTLSNFATESIYRHLAFYWSSTVQILKEFIQRQ